MDYKDHLRGNFANNFWFRGKYDLMKVLLSMNLKKRKNKILVLGAGTGEDLKIISKFGDIYAIDIDKNAFDLIPKNLVFEKKIANATKLPYKKEFFDSVISFDVFEHIKNDKLALLEAHRVLKKKGKLIFGVPAFNFIFGSHDEALGHFRRYNKKTFKPLVKKFKKVTLSYWNFIFFIPITLFIRLPGKIIKKKKTDNFNLPKILDDFALLILKFENYLISKKISLPFGLSLIGYCEK
ncbi:class I SAM-dependent methyltransferase [archaeon]|nr:class I SAM-dependent methyltransferase [archaeon]